MPGQPTKSKSINHATKSLMWKAYSKLVWVTLDLPLFLDLCFFLSLIAAMPVRISDDYISHFSQAEHKWPEQVRCSHICSGHCSAMVSTSKGWTNTNAAHFPDRWTHTPFALPFRDANHLEERLVTLACANSQWVASISWNEGLYCA